MTLTLKRKYILGLGNWLKDLLLVGQESRNRTKFLETLQDELNEMEAMRLEILKKYAKLDDEGNIVMVTENDEQKYDVPDDKLKEFQFEFIQYLEGEFILGGPGLKERLTVMKHIVLNTSQTIDPKIAGDYSEWCDAFEAMTEDSQ